MIMIGFALGLVWQVQDMQMDDAQVVGRSMFSLNKDVQKKDRRSKLKKQAGIRFDVEERE